MTIEFKEEQIALGEERSRQPYIGYFAPSGKLIDYNILLGEGHHEDWYNPVSWAFLSLVSYIVEGTSIEKLIEGHEKTKLLLDMVADNQYPGIDEFVVRGYGDYYDFNMENFDYFLEKLYGRIRYIENIYHGSGIGSMEDYTAFEYQLLLFFKNAYKDKKFFDTIQRRILIENPNEVKERLKYEYSNCNYANIDSIYRYYLKIELLSHFKDICVQYLGYDSLERFKPNGTEIEIPHPYDEYDFDFSANPRIITSSYSNVNERYYNYLLMDWVVHRLPRYYYNEQTRLYEKSDFHLFYQSETEEKLAKEIQSIKKLVPLKERKKYFR